MDNKNIKIFIGSGLLLVLLLLGLYSLGDIKYSVKEGLSYEEKKRDAKYLIDFLENTYPYFDEIKTDTGQDILKERNKIISSISKTSSDEDFFDEISVLLRRLIYGYVNFNMSSDPFSYDYTHLDKNLGLTIETYRNKFKEGKLKWEPIHKKHLETIYSAYYPSNISATYFNGDYYITMSQNPDAHIGDKVISVDGVPVDEYVKSLVNDKFFKGYDYNNEKFIAYDLFRPTNKKLKKAIIKDSEGNEKKIEILPFDPTKLILENGFSNVNSTVYMGDDKTEHFLNSLEQGKILALNFSAFEDTQNYSNDSKKKEELYSSIAKSNYLILDLRSGGYFSVLEDILQFVSSTNAEYSDYTVIKKNEITDEYIKYYNNYKTPSITEIASPIESLNTVYPLSDYHIFKEKHLQLNGLNKYKGKVFLLFDTLSASDYTCQLLKIVIEHNIATVITNGKFPLSRFEHNNSLTSFILPNSNISLVVQTSKAVDENGNLVGKKVVTPQVIIKEDTSEFIDDLKSGKAFRNTLNGQDQYTSKDEYFNEVLKLID